MNKRGPIVVIEDDADDRDLYKMVFRELGYPNELALFPDGESALGYLNRPDVFPFLVISDINMPKMNGFALKKVIQTDEALREKCIPYVFFSTSVSQEAVADAFAMSAQGFFVKPSSFDHLKNLLKSMLDYWRECYSPASYETVR